MPRPDVTQLLAANWHSLPQEDGNPLRLMHFSQFGKDEKTRAAVTVLGVQLGDAAQILLERRGYTISHKDDVQPADADGYKQVAIKCVACGKQLLSLGCDDQLNAHLGGLAIKSLTQLTHECKP